jgi:hypothetical protein
MTVCMEGLVIYYVRSRKPWRIMLNIIIIKLLSFINSNSEDDAKIPAQVQHI